MGGGILEGGNQIFQAVFSTEKQVLPAAAAHLGPGVVCVNAPLRYSSGCGNNSLSWQVFVQSGFGDCQWVTVRVHQQDRLRQHPITNYVIAQEVCSIFVVKGRWQRSFATCWHLPTDAGQHSLNTRPEISPRNSSCWYVSWLNYPVLAAGADPWQEFGFRILSSCRVLQPGFSHVWVPSNTPQ